MIISPIWSEDITIEEYNQNVFDPNRKGFFFTLAQRKEFNVDGVANEAELLVIIAKVFASLVLDAQRKIEYYIYNRLRMLPNGYDSLRDLTKKAMREALYLQIQYAQYNRGNFVENDGITQYSQGSQANITIAPSTNIFASDSLSLESRNIIDFTGFRVSRLEVWWPLVTEAPLPND